MDEKDKNELLQKVNTFNAPIDTSKGIAESVIDAQRKSPMTVKEAIDLEATNTALKDPGNLGMIVQTKGQELLNDAEAKKVEAETERIRKETDKIKQEREKELADLQKTIDNLQKQAEQIKAENDKAQQYFESHKSILRCVGIRERLSLGAMQFWIWPASIVYAIFQFLLLPITICGFTFEQVVGIIDAVCGKIQKGAVRIIISVLTIVLIGAIVCGCYVLLAHFVIK